MSNGEQLYPPGNERDENTLVFDLFNGGNFADAFHDLVETARRNSSNQLPSLELVASTPRSDTTFKRDVTEARNKQNEKGEIIGREEKNQDKSVATYDNEGRIVRVQMANGEWRRFDRDTQGRVTQITESNGVQWNSKDGKIFQLSGSNDQVRGALEINKDGSYAFGLKEGEFRRNTDKSMSLVDALGQERVRFYDNGAQMARDEYGRITDTRDAQGRERHFAWDAGKLRSIKEPDGKIWDRVDGQGKQWRLRGSDKIRQGEVEVEADGSYTVKDGSGATVSFQLDASVISRNSKGQVNAVQDSSGGVRRFHRDEQGKIDLIKEPNGTIWTLKEKDKTAAGNDTWKKGGTDSTWTGKVEVDNYTGVYKETNAGSQTIKSPDAWVKRIDKDGNTTLDRENIDGSKIKKNSSGQITDITNAAGRSYKIEYDAGAQIVKVQCPKETLLARDGKIEVGDNGTIRQKLNGGGEKLLKSDGSIVTKDEQQRVTSVLCANGRGHLFEYDANGSISKMTEIDRKGQKTEWVKVGAHEWSKDGGKTKSSFDLQVFPGGTVEEFFPASSNKTAFGTDGSEIKVNKKGAVLYSEHSNGDFMRYQIDENGQQRRNKDAEPLPEKTWKADRSIVEYNKQGLISAVQDKNGVKREFEYDKDGKVSLVKDEFGTYRRDDSHAGKRKGDLPLTQKWLKDDGSTWEGRVDVNQSTGTYAYFDRKSLTRVENYTDGHKEKDIFFERPGARGAYRLVEDDKGRLCEIHNGNGSKYELQYDANNQLNKITTGKLSYERKGDHWECSDGKRYEKIEVQEKGLITFTDSEKVSFRKPDGRPDVEVYNNLTARRVKELGIQYKENYWSSDSEVLKVLQNLNPEEVKALKAAYAEKYKEDLEETVRKRFGNNENKEQALAILQKTDDRENNAGRIQIASKEMESFVKRPQRALEADIRHTIKVMSREEIRELSAQYRKNTNGRDLYTDLLNNKNISAETKLALGVYWSGSDNRNEKDILNLAYKAIDAGRLELFKEAMSVALPETRKRFLDYGGKNKLEEKFGGSWLAPLSWLAASPLDVNGVVGDLLGIPRLNWSDENFLDAMDYAKHGKLSVDRQVDKNTRWFGDNVEAIENGLKAMTDEERQAYRNGVFMTRKQDQSLPVSYSEASHLYETPAIAGNYVTLDQAGQQVITVENVNKMLSDKFVLMDPIQRQAWEELLKHPSKNLNAEGAFSLEQLHRKERDDFQVYAAVRNNLYAAAGNFLSPNSVKAEMAKWEYMAMNSKGHQFVNGLYSHVGKVYSSTKEELLSTIESMSKEDWQYLKAHPEAQAKVCEILACFPGVVPGSEKTNAARESFRRKMSASTFEEATQIQRGVVQRIRDNSFGFSQSDRVQTDRANVYEAIEHMSQDEKDRYARGKKPGAAKEDKVFAVSVDEAVKDAFWITAPQAAKDVAEGMLANIAKNPRGEVLGLAELINKYRADESLNLTGLVRELQARLKKEPALLKRLQDPDSDERKSFDQSLKWIDQTFARAIMFQRERGWKDLKRDLIEPLLKGGDPPLAVQLQYDCRNDSPFTRDMKGFMQDMANAPQEERDKLRNDHSLRLEAFQNLNERFDPEKFAQVHQLSMQILEQGAIKPEDHLRAYVLGWERSEDALRVLASLQPEERKQVEAAYEKKYHVLLLVDLEESGMSKADLRIARGRLMPEPLSDMEAYNRARTLHYESGYGFGPRLMKGTGWDGTVDQAWDAVNRYTKAMSDAHAEGRQLTTDEQTRFQQQVRDRIEALIRSKEAFAERATEAVIMMAAMGTGGTASPLLLGLVVGLSAGFKVVADKAIMGEDYDGSLKHVLGDAFSGGFSAILNNLGPAELGKIAGLGKAVANRAVGVAIADLEKQVGKTALKIPLGKLQERTADIVGQGILSGAKEFDQKAILQLAHEAVGPERAEGFAKMLMGRLSDATMIESRSFLQRQFTAYTATAITGSAAGGTANFAREIIRSDFMRESPGQILERAGGAFREGAIAGAPMAIGFHASFQVLGAGWRGAKLAREKIVFEKPPEVFKTNPLKEGEVAGKPETKGKTSSDAEGNLPDRPGKPAENGQPKPEAKENGARPKPVENPKEGAGKTMAGIEKPMVKIEGHNIEPGNTYTIGRSDAGKGDLLVDNPHVSARHARIRVDAQGNKFITDLDSKNGTFVNGKKLDANVETKIGAMDKVRLGPHYLNIKDPALTVKVGSSNLDLQPGQEVQIGRGKDGISNGAVSSNHAKLGRDAAGYYLVDESSNGTYVTRDGKDIRLEQHRKFYLQEGDEVGLGRPVGRGGERLKLSTDQAAEVVKLGLVKDGIGPKALKQSNDYGRYHEITDRIEDGWSNAGENAEFQADGSFNKTDRPALVVDRQNDPVLRAALDEAKVKFGHLPPAERAKALTKWAREKLTPPGKFDLDRWYDEFNTQHAGQRIYFGEFLQEGKGVCSQQAILLKLAVDEFPDMHAKLIRGNYYNGWPRQLNHAWTEIDFRDEGPPLVYDPRMGILGEKYGTRDTYKHSPGRDVKYPLEVGDKVVYGGRAGWNVKKVEGNNVIISNMDHRYVGKSQVNMEFKLGESYALKGSNGKMEPGWIFMGPNPDGRLHFYKTDAIVLTVPRNQLTAGKGVK